MCFNIKSSKPKNMGQYYQPTVIDKKGKVLGWVYSHDYGNGLKLMEHSWLTNSFVNAVITLFMPGGKFNKQRLVWAGDYANNQKGFKENEFNRCTDAKQLKPDVPKQSEVNKFPFLVNHSKQVFVKVNKLIKKDSWEIHPLPLLTCDGNGQGGGDYFGKDPNGLVGSWARDVISVEAKKPEGFAEVIFDLKEY